MVPRKTKSPENQTMNFPNERTYTSEIDVPFSSASASEASTSGSANGNILVAAAGNLSSNTNNAVVAELGKNLQATAEANAGLSEGQSWKRQLKTRRVFKIMKHWTLELRSLKNPFILSLRH